LPVIFPVQIIYRIVLYRIPFLYLLEMVTVAPQQGHSTNISESLFLGNPVWHRITVEKSAI